MTADRCSPEQPRVCVLGVGQMGLVCAGVLSQPGDDPNTPRATVRLWGHDDVEAGNLAQTRRSPRLPGFDLPPSARVALSDEEALLHADLIVSAIPVQFIREAWTRLRPHVPEFTPVVSVAKGIETGTLLRPTQIIADALADDPDARPRALGCLSGPTIAGELARCLPATMVAASDHPGFAEEVQRLFTTSWLRVYTNPDLLGVELAGATKNVIAIAAGIIDGLGAGHNAKSALLARGLAEIARLGSAMGAHTETFFGVAGAGDLATTCFSPEGRNRSCGEALGRGAKLNEYIEQSMCVVEGVATTRSVMDLADKYRVEMPIARAVHAVLFEKLDPVDAITMLMSRELTGERIAD
ncbi:MAG: NAD(P)-dependent glycerol-3-phosphate dehydrogenase [Phycisphaerales bacterium]|nr:NAD(P)-dependent glycerol-3-phosphate dehydrogenase [Phycisphaerales bacterium]